MPAWWRGKSKSNPSPNSSSKKEEESRPTATAKPGGRQNKKEKARSFDDAVDKKNCRCPEGRSLPVADSNGERRRHPLPPPLISSSSSLPLDHGTTAVSGSASLSSVSSSGTDETPDLGFYRYSEPVNTPRGRTAMPDSQRQQHVAEDIHLFSCSPVLEHERLSDISISPRKEFQLHGPDAFSNVNGYRHCRASTESIFNPRSRSPGPGGSRGYNLSTSPVHPRAFAMSPELQTGRQDDLKSPPHPLPLPPGSPTSSTSRSFQSQWKKGKLIGRGTFGHVFVGFNSESGQMCAVKEVKVISDDSNSKECLKQLNQEITLLSQLSHPNIVQYYGSELSEDTLSVYLEYVSGGSIFKLLQDYGPFGEPVIRSYAAQILSGLAYLHGRNTIHRDIKGANILVDPNGVIKLADFGMAKHISSYTSIRSFKGSPYWMAPEVIMNTGGYNLSVDIWSLGCTILEMATSKPPWCKYEGVAAIFKIGNSKDIPEIPDHISNDGKKFLKLCLQRDPSARPTAAQLMDHPFVRDQATIHFARVNINRDIFPSSDGTHTPRTTEFPYNRSISPLHARDYPLRHTIACSPTLKSPSDLVSMRMNMSLPVSPCSSPLRNFRASNWSCFPSPPHPAYAAGVVKNGVSNYSSNPMGPSTKYVDPWTDISQLKSQTPYDSPRR